MKKYVLLSAVFVSMFGFAAAASADKVVVYNGYGPGGGYDGRYAPPRRCKRKFRRRGYGRGRGYYREKHVYHHYNPAPAYVPVPVYHHHGYVSQTPVIAGSIIGGVVGAEVGQGGPLALGGALLGASIGRDIAHRRHYRD